MVDKKILNLSIKDFQQELLSPDKDNLAFS